MINAYFDDSGIRGSMVSVCGFAAHDENCAKLAREWLDLLRKNHIDHLHTSAFMAGGEHNERLAAVTEFAKCLRRNAELFVSVALETNGARSDAIEFCMERVVKRTTETLNGWSGECVPFAMIFDDSQDAVRLHGAMLRLRDTRKEVGKSVAAYTFADDRHFQPVQAADLLAWATTNEFRRRENAWKDGPLRDALLAESDLLTHLTVVSEWWTWDELVAKWAELTDRSTDVRNKGTSQGEGSAP